MIAVAQGRAADAADHGVDRLDVGVALERRRGRHVVAQLVHQRVVDVLGLVGQRLRDRVLDARAGLFQHVADAGAGPGAHAQKDVVHKAHASRAALRPDKPSYRPEYRASRAWPACRPEQRRRRRGSIARSPRAQPLSSLRAVRPQAPRRSRGKAQPSPLHLGTEQPGTCAHSQSYPSLDPSLAHPNRACMRPIEYNFTREWQQLA